MKVYYLRTENGRKAYWANIREGIKRMKGYKEISMEYDKKFLNYIISRSKALSAGYSSLEYEDLVQDGLLKLCTLKSKCPTPADPVIMQSLVNMYNSIYKEVKESPRFITWEEK